MCYPDPITPMLCQFVMLCPDPPSVGVQSQTSSSLALTNRNSLTGLQTSDSKSTEPLSYCGGLVPSQRDFTMTIVPDRKDNAVCTHKPITFYGTQSFLDQRHHSTLALQVSNRNSRFTATCRSYLRLHQWLRPSVLLRTRVAMSNGRAWA